MASGVQLCHDVIRRIGGSGTNVNQARGDVLYGQSKRVFRVRCPRCPLWLGSRAPYVEEFSGRVRAARKRSEQVVTKAK